MAANALIPNALREHYKQHGQEQVFELVDKGLAGDNAAEINAFVKQLESIDVKLVNDLYEATTADAQENKQNPGEPNFEPVEQVDSIEDANPDQVSEWQSLGLRAVANGALAVLTLAGGQGTRLGFDRPKGEYDIGLPLHKTLFQLQAERLHRIRELAAVHSGKDVNQIVLPWYIMTSPMTDQDTRDHFESRNYYGIRKEDVFFFSQGTLPCLTSEGKIILETSTKIAESPDGNGGIYRALHLTGAIDDMKKRGVQYIHAFAVDNALVRVADPLFIGNCIARGADVGAKVCRKVSAEEAVGVICKRNGKYAVVEYSDMDDATKEKRTESGELEFSAGNICIHFYTLQYLEETCHPDKLPKVYHLAHKKIPYADPSTGETVSRSELKKNTGIKLETFIFDVFPMAHQMAVLEVKREFEFAPVKNAPGSSSDSPGTAREMYSKLSRAWLEAAGAKIEGPSNALCEVSPLATFRGEDLEKFSGLLINAPLAIVAKGESLPDKFRSADAQPIADGAIRQLIHDGVNFYQMQ